MLFYPILSYPVLSYPILYYTILYYSPHRSDVSGARPDQRALQGDQQGPNRLRSISEISSYFFGPRPWHIEIRHRVKKTSTIDLFGFETLKLTIRRLKLWKPTVHPVRNPRFGSFRTQPLDILSADSEFVCYHLSK